VFFFTSEQNEGMETNSKHDIQSEVSDIGSFLAKGPSEKSAKEGTGQREFSFGIFDVRLA